MHCPFCHRADTKVVDSRLSCEGDSVRRRRSCSGCGERFTTFEVAEMEMPLVVKNSGERVVFDEQKLYSGMMRALEKRPVAGDDIDAAIKQIRQQIRNQAEREIPSRQIGEWVMEQLRQLDEVAYVRFASVYRRFKDVNAFREEIERMQQQTDTGAEL
ncbi:transcriptional repressor NrdR [Ectothiorhodospiraceae bacterium BW-2]|nr:transcriptional repressor NrdR [Ectothiorhodospiraceae bacterium BW-2]